MLVKLIVSFFVVGHVCAQGIQAGAAIGVFNAQNSLPRGLVKPGISNPLAGASDATPVNKKIVLPKFPVDAFVELGFSLEGFGLSSSEGLHSSMEGVLKNPFGLATGILGQPFSGAVTSSLEGFGLRGPMGANSLESWGPFGFESREGLFGRSSEFGASAEGKFGSSSESGKFGNFAMFGSSMELPFGNSIDTASLFGDLSMEMLTKPRPYDASSKLVVTKPNEKMPTKQAETSTETVTAPIKPMPFRPPAIPETNSASTRTNAP